MSEHLSKTTIENLLTNDLSASELLMIEDHIADCVDCADQVAAVVAPENHVDIDAGSNHLTYDMLEAYANSAISAVDMEVADVHLRRCALCTTELDDLVALRNELETTTRPEMAEIRRPFFESIFKPAFLVPALAALILGMTGSWWILQSGRTDEAQNNRSNAGVQSTANVPADETTGGVVPAVSNLDSNTRLTPVATIHDGAATIELYADGRITGIDTSVGKVRDALLKQTIDIPADVRGLHGASGVLMGDGTDGVPFALLAPVGKVIGSSRPVMSWRPMPGAESYRVEIFDSNFNRIAASPSLTRAAWQVDRPLARGKIYTWQVTAVKGGIEIKSPARPAPEAKFKVIDDESAAAIAAARAGDSKLVLGLAYARAGMLDDAERQFRELARANPNSEAIKRLLQKVRAAR